MYRVVEPIIEKKGNV